MKLVLVEDHLIIREAIRRMCEAVSGLSVVGETDSGTEAIELILRRRPDLVLLDLGLADLDGFTVAERVRVALPELRILILSGRIDDYTVQRVARLRVQGFIDKSTGNLAGVQGALHALALGQTFFSASFRAFKEARQADPRACVKVLSETEQQVLRWIGRGLSDAEIGHRLGMAPSTAQTHRSNILRKLGLDGTPRLVAFANQSGFVRSAG